MKYLLFYINVESGELYREIFNYYEDAQEYKNSSEVVGASYIVIGKFEKIEDYT